MASQFIESVQVLNARAKRGHVMADSPGVPGEDYEEGNTLETVTTRKGNIHMRIIFAMPLYSPMAIGRKHGTSCYKEGRKSRSLEIAMKRWGGGLVVL